MSTSKVALDIKKRSVEDKRQKNSWLLSSTMRGEYTPKPLAYDVHHTVFRLVEIFEYPSS